MPRPMVYRNTHPSMRVRKNEELPVADEPGEDFTKDEIKAYLDARGVEYTTRMTKDELLELI